MVGNALLRELQSVKAKAKGHSMITCSAPKVFRLSSTFFSGFAACKTFRQFPCLVDVPHRAIREYFATSSGMHYTSQTSKMFQITSHYDFETRSTVTFTNNRQLSRGIFRRMDYNATHSTLDRAPACAQCATGLLQQWSGDTIRLSD